MSSGISLFVTSNFEACSNHPHGQEREKDRGCKDVEGTKQGATNEYIGIEHIERSLVASTVKTVAAVQLFASARLLDRISRFQRNHLVLGILLQISNNKASVILIMK